MNLDKWYTGVSCTLFIFATFCNFEIFPKKKFFENVPGSLYVFRAQALQSAFSPEDPSEQEYLTTLKERERERKAFLAYGTT